MKKWIKTLIGCAFVVILVGCATPIRDVQTPVYGRSVTQVEKAIMEAGRDRGWVMKRVQSGVINAHLDARRGQQVNIRIDYSANDYRISYVSSQNVKKARGKIHRNYDRWIGILDRDIQLKLSTH